jgi:hypothetical protein
MVAAAVQAPQKRHLVTPDRMATQLMHQFCCRIQITHPDQAVHPAQDNIGAVRDGLLKQTKQFSGGIKLCHAHLGHSMPVKKVSGFAIQHGVFHERQLKKCSKRRCNR